MIGLSFRVIDGVLYMIGFRIRESNAENCSIDYRTRGDFMNSTSIIIVIIGPLSA